MIFHSHDWVMIGSKRLEMYDWTFMVTIYRCVKCRDIRSRASDMQPYLDMKSVELRPDGLYEDGVKVE